VQVIGEQDVKVFDAVSTGNGAFGEDAGHGTQVACEKFRGAAHYVWREFCRRPGGLLGLSLRIRSGLLVFLRRGESVTFQSLHQIMAASQERATVGIHVNGTGKNADEIDRILGLRSGSARQDSGDGPQE